MLFRKSCPSRFRPDSPRTNLQQAPGPSDRTEPEGGHHAKADIPTGQRARRHRETAPRRPRRGRRPHPGRRMDPTGIGRRSSGTAESDTGQGKISRSARPLPMGTEKSTGDRSRRHSPARPQLQAASKTPSSRIWKTASTTPCPGSNWKAGSIAPAGPMKRAICTRAT